MLANVLSTTLGSVSTPTLVSQYIGQYICRSLCQGAAAVPVVVHLLSLGFDELLQLLDNLLQTVLRVSHVVSDAHLILQRHHRCTVA